MEYVFLAFGAATVGAGIYLIRRHWQGGARDDDQRRRVFLPAPERQAQAAFRVLPGRYEESHEAVHVDFTNYRVSQ